MVDRAPIVNAHLAGVLAKEPNPIEKLDSNQSRAMTALPASGEALVRNGRLVMLECGHFIVTRALKRAGCPRCGEMIRAGYDYDGYRRLGNLDDFDWPGDPLRSLHQT